MEEELSVLTTQPILQFTPPGLHPHPALLFKQPSELFVAIFEYF